LALPSYKKNAKAWLKDLIDKLDTAIKNSKKLQEHNNKTASTNPATNMHEMIEYLMTLKITK
jgi:hypothetical protein